MNGIFETDTVIYRLPYTSINKYCLWCMFGYICSEIGRFSLKCKRNKKHAYWPALGQALLFPLDGYTPRRAPSDRIKVVTHTIRTVSRTCHYPPKKQTKKLLLGNRRTKAISIYTYPCKIVEWWFFILFQIICTFRAFWF